MKASLVTSISALALAFSSGLAFARPFHRVDYEMKSAVSVAHAVVADFGRTQSSWVPGDFTVTIDAVQRVTSFGEATSKQSKVLIDLLGARMAHTLDDQAYVTAVSCDVFCQTLAPGKVFAAFLGEMSAAHIGVMCSFNGESPLSAENSARRLLATSSSAEMRCFYARP